MRMIWSVHLITMTPGVHRQHRVQLLIRTEQPARMCSFKVQSNGAEGELNWWREPHWSPYRDWEENETSDPKCLSYMSLQSHLCNIMYG